MVSESPRQWMLALGSCGCNRPDLQICIGWTSTTEVLCMSDVRPLRFPSNVLVSHLIWINRINPPVEWNWPLNQPAYSWNILKLALVWELVWPRLAAGIKCLFHVDYVVYVKTSQQRTLFLQVQSLNIAWQHFCWRQRRTNPWILNIPSASMLLPFPSKTWPSFAIQILKYRIIFWSYWQEWSTRLPLLWYVWYVTSCGPVAVIGTCVYVRWQAKALCGNAHESTVSWPGTKFIEILGIEMVLPSLHKKKQGMVLCGSTRPEKTNGKTEWVGLQCLFTLLRSFSDWESFVQSLQIQHLSRFASTDPTENLPISSCKVNGFMKVSFYSTGKENSNLQIFYGISSPKGNDTVDFWCPY